MEKTEIEVWKIGIPIIVLITLVEVYRHYILLVLGGTPPLANSWVLLYAIIPLVFWFSSICFLNMKLRSLSLKESLIFLGFIPIQGKPLVVGLLAGLAYVLPIGGMALYFHSRATLMVPNWPVLLLWLILGPGFEEEAVFRGFAFRNLS